MYRRLGDRMVLIHLQTNDIFDLNETATRFWELLSSGGELEPIEAAMAAEFDVDPTVLHREVLTTLSALSERELITGYDPR